MCRLYHWCAMGRFNHDFVMPAYTAARLICLLGRFYSTIIVPYRPYRAISRYTALSLSLVSLKVGASCIVAECFTSFERSAGRLCRGVAFLRPPSVRHRDNCNRITGNTNRAADAALLRNVPLRCRILETLRFPKGAQGLGLTFQDIAKFIHIPATVQHSRRFVSQKI